MECGCNSRIEVVYDESGNAYYEEDVAENFVSYFSNFLGTYDKVFNIEDLTSLFTNDIEDNTPGPDGYTSKFYKATWKVVGDDTCSTIKEYVFDRVPDMPLPVESNPILSHEFNMDNWIRGNSNGSNVSNVDLLGEVKRGGLYFFMFKYEDGLQSVIGNGPWLVDQKPLFVQRWGAGICLNKLEPTRIPLWVKIYKLPLEAWNVEVNGIVDNIKIWYNSWNITMELRVEKYVSVKNNVKEKVSVMEDGNNEDNEDIENEWQGIKINIDVACDMAMFIGDISTNRRSIDVNVLEKSNENVVEEMENSGSSRNQDFDVAYARAYRDEIERIREGWTDEMIEFYEASIAENLQSGNEYVKRMKVCDTNHIP
ncbi:zinc knuckle CX2CX4HX4C containing protein [Tanacetum coccineum]